MTTFTPVSNFRMKIEPREEVGNKPKEKTPCPVCNGMRFVISNYSRRAVPCPMIDNHPENFARSSGLTIDDLNLSMDYYITHNLVEQRKMCNFLMQAIERQQGIYVLYGGMGNGKTSAAKAAALMAAKEHRQSVYYTTMYKIVDSVKEGFNKQQSERDYKAPMLKRIEQSDFVIIDEFDRFNVTDWSKELFFKIIDDLYANRKNKTVILITNTPIFEAYKTGQLDGHGNEIIKSRLAGNYNKRGLFAPIGERLRDAYLYGINTKSLRGRDK